MNLKKGLNRVVLVLAVLWLVAGFPLAYSKAKTTRDSACTEAVSLTSKLNRFAAAYDDQQANHGPWEKYGTSGVRVKGPDEKMYLFPAATTKEDAVTYFKQRVADEQRCQTAKPIKTALLFALLPAIIGYGLFHLLFATVLWVFRGFSEK
jgi:hypothetical protein